MSAQKIQSFINVIQDGVTRRALQKIFEAVNTELDGIRTVLSAFDLLADEFVDDHATMKTVVDEIKTVVNAGTGTVSNSSPATLASPKNPTSILGLESLTT